MRLRIHALVALLTLSPALAFAVPAIAEPPTQTERTQIERIIHDYLLNNPELMIEVLRAAEAKQKQQQEESARSVIAARRDEIFNDPSAPVGGNAKGDVTVVEFFDYQCPYCKQVQPTVEALVKEDPKVRIAYKEFPILGPQSTFAAHVALAALKQGKYERFHTAMMAAKGQITEEIILKVAADAGLDVIRVKADMKEPEIDRIIKRNRDLGDALSIRGTPTFIIGDDLIPGAVDLATLRQMVIAARKPK